MVDTSQYPIAAQLLALCKLAGVTPRMFEALFRHLGPPERILKAASASILELDGMTAEAAERISSALNRLDEAQSLLDNLASRDISVASRFADGYPPLLFELNDPPPLLFVRGRLTSPDKRSVAVIGAEAATNEGIRMATLLAKRFAEEGVQVISSLSGGIDFAAHLGCKSAAGESFAVLDVGFDQLGGDEAMPLAIDIAQAGGVISEHLPDEKPDVQAMAQANRILSGLAQAVVVPEMYADSARALDIVTCCNQVGKLTFFMIDPELGALADEESLSHALQSGAIPIEGYDRLDEIIKALV